jgi:hypothetical protein
MSHLTPHLPRWLPAIHPGPRRRSDVLRSFLAAMRHSQLFEVFIQERLEMVSCGLVQLPGPHGSASSHSFSYNGAGAAAARARLASMRISGSGAPMTKSSSATNLAGLAAMAERSSAGGSGGGGGSGSEPGAREGDVGLTSVQLPGLPEHGEAFGGGACRGEALLDPFEQRVGRFLEQRRLVRERLRAALSTTASVSGGPATGTSRLGSKLRRHRRTDSEDLLPSSSRGLASTSAGVLSQQAGAGGAAGSSGHLHGGDSMRRVPTYPSVLGEL